MNMIIDFPGGARVDAHFGQFTIPTDQPPHSTAPTPFATFLASIGTCAGIYVLGFCMQRGIPTSGIRIVQNLEVNRTTGLVSEINLDIQLPPEFPDKYRKAVVRSADQCAVKKHFEHPPQITVISSKENEAVSA